MGTTIVIIAVIAVGVIVAAVLLSRRGKGGSTVTITTNPKGTNSGNSNTQPQGKYTQNDRKLLELIDDLADMYKQTGR